MAQLQRVEGSPGCYTADVGGDRYRVMPTGDRYIAACKSAPRLTFTRRTLGEIRRELGRRHTALLAAAGAPPA